MARKIGEDKPGFAVCLPGTECRLSSSLQGAPSSDGIWRTRSVPNGKGETCPGAGGVRSGCSRAMGKGASPPLCLQVPLHSPLL